MYRFSDILSSYHSQICLYVAGCSSSSTIPYAHTTVSVKLHCCVFIFSCVSMLIVNCDVITLFEGFRVQLCPWLLTLLKGHILSLLLSDGNTTMSHYVHVIKLDLIYIVVVDSP